MATGAGDDQDSAATAPRRPSLVAFCCAAVAVAAVTARLAGASASELTPSGATAEASTTERGLDGAVIHASGRRLTTSTKCRQALETMLTDENFNFMDRAFNRWCRIKAENEMARCCRVADFALGRGEVCGYTSECFTTCHYSRMMDLCNAHFGKACSVDRKLFGGSPLRVSETFCVPEECDNDSDRENLLNWFSTLYAARLTGWQSNWDDAVLNCPSSTVGALLWTLLAIFLTVVLLVILYLLMVAPKEQGRELISQAEMQAEAEAEAEKEQYNDLRGTAQMGDSLGQTGLSR